MHLTSFFSAALFDSSNQQHQLLPGSTNIFTGSSDEEVTDAAKEDIKKTSEAKDDTKKIKLPPTSSSLSVSLGFGDQFLKLSFDSSLVSTVKDTTDAEINSLLEVKIQSEVPHIQSPSMLTVLVSVIFEPLVLTLVQESPSEAIVTTLPPLSVSTTPFLRVAKLEKDVSNLKKIDLFAAALAALKTQFSSVIDNYLGSKTPTVDLEQGSKKSASQILKIKKEQVEKQQTLSHKRKHDDDEYDDDEDPLVRPNQCKKTKRRRTKESESSKKPSTTKKTPKGKAPSKGSKTDTSEPKKAKTLNPEWFIQPPRPPTPDPKWNKLQVVLDQLEQPWFNQMVSTIKDPLTLNDLMATLIDFSKIKLEYHFQECFNTLTNSLDWNNPEGDGYPFELSKPFPLQGHPGHLTVAGDYFFNNDLEYLKSYDSERTYTTSITKTKAARYKIERIEDVVPTLWNSTKVGCDKDKLHRYGHLEEITMKRVDRQLYKFKEGDFMDLHMNDTEDMLLLVFQHKLFHLTDSDIVDFIKKLNNTLPQLTVPEIEFKEAYTLSHKPPGVIYKDLVQQKRVIRADELYKFLDGTLKKVRDELHHRVLDFDLGYNKEMERRKWTAINKKRSALMVELFDKQIRERRIIQNLERLIGARELEMDYKLMTRTV
nr:hypothetical protein [Tanacetum cinerariifolium]